MSLRVKILEPVQRPRRFITGFAGLGMVGYLVVHHLVQALPCRRIGYVRLMREPPFTAYITSREFLSTPIELYHCQNGDLVIAVPHWDGDFMFRFADIIARALAQWVYLNGFEEAILFGGLDNRLRGGDPSDFRVACTSAWRSKMPSWFKEMELNYAIVGPLAVLLNEFERLGVPAVSILPYAEPLRADPNAAIVAIQVLEHLTGISVNIDRLRELAEAVEREIKEIQESLRMREGPPRYI